VQLHGNQVGAEGGRALMAALKVLGAERDLGLKGCVFKEAVGFPARPPPALCDSLARRREGAHGARS
jgi:hypothetical protein